MAEYIDKKAANRVLTAIGVSVSTSKIRTVAKCISAVDLIPAADVAPVRHGRWIYGEDVDIQCSVCGADALTEGDYRQVKSDFCPNCGARMDLEDES